MGPDVGQREPSCGLRIGRHCSWAMTMKPAITGIALALLLWTGTTCATSKVARSLDIRAEDETVLACIPRDEGDPVDIDAAGIISGGEEGDHRVVISWQIVLDAGKPPLRLEPGECLASHRLPPGYVDTVQPAGLKDEWLYSFSIRSPRVGKYGTRNYNGKFCIRHTNDGLQVVQVPRTPGAITAAICHRLLGSPAAPENAR